MQVTIDHWGSQGHAVAYAGTRREYVHVGSVATSLSLKVPT